MKIKKVTAVYFSPTGGTKACAEAIASELASDYGTVNLTFPYERKQVHEFGPEDLVIIGAPVYAGRIPAVEGGLFSSLRGNDTPAVFLVSYGNRAYDDALLEEKDLCEARGFRGIGASAWIAPHTFSSRIGAGRPDAEDREKIHAFAQRIQVLAEGGVPAGEPTLPRGACYALSSGGPPGMHSLPPLCVHLSRAGYQSSSAGEN